MQARLLALDTSTERLAVALGDGTSSWRLDESGGARASSRLLAAVHELLAQARWSLRDLDAIAFGAGPGAFTGLRSACAVAQGLAFGLGVPVIALDSLLIVADDARTQLGTAAPDSLWVAMDARMDEIYAGQYRWQDGDWQVRSPPLLYPLDSLLAHWRAEPPTAVAGSAIAAFGARLDAGAAHRLARENDRAGALLALALRGWRQRRTLPPSAAAPLYLRDKVALTTAEREARRDAGGGA